MIWSLIAISFNSVQDKKKKKKCQIAILYNSIEQIITV